MVIPYFLHDFIGKYILKLKKYPNKNNLNRPIQKYEENLAEEIVKMTLHFIEYAV